jgi:thioesterase domain-containing protein
VLCLPRVGSTDDFYALGGSPASAHRLIERVRGDLGIEITVADLDAAPTVRSLASAIDRGDFPPIPGTVKTLQTGTGTIPLFLLPGVRGHVSGLAELARALETDHTIYGLQPRGLDGTSPSHQTIHDMADHLIHAVRTVAPTGPYVLIGYSAGGIVAYEMAQRWRQAGDEVIFLAMLDAPAPGHSPQSKRILWHVKRLFKQSPRAAIAYGWQRLTSVFGRILRARRAAAPGGAPPVGSPLWRVQQSMTHFFNAMNQYAPQPSDTHVTLFTAEDGFKMDDPTLGWRDLARAGVEVVLIPGDHVQMMKRPGVERLAQEMRSRLTRAIASSNKP